MGKLKKSIWTRFLIYCFILLPSALCAQSQPFLVKDINAITNPNPSSNPTSFVSIGSVAYFIAYDPIHDRELWRSDGTAVGTWLVKDLNPGAGYSWLGYSSDLINVNGILFFAASDPATGIELWRSDGTASGTTVVKDIFPGIESSYPGELVNINNVLYFTATTPSCGIAIWKSDGTANGTTMVFCGKYVQELAHVNDNLFFTNFDDDHGSELWKLDLSNEVSTLVKDIYSGIESSAPSQLTNSNGSLFFIARQQQTGKELWKSDGTDDGTVMVKDIFVGPADSMDWFSQITAVNGIVFFGADDGINGIELWKSDGTEAGTVLLKDIYSGSNGSWPRAGINLNGTYIFAAEDYDTTGIWRSDGTPDGTYKLTRPYDYYQYSLAKVGNVAFFSTANYYPMTLWKTDGTTEGTMVVGYVQKISDFGDINGTLFFGGDDGSTGTELWKSDGTDSGTVFIKDLNPLVTDSSWINLSTSFNNELFFSAIDGIHGRELWKSDGTGVGTTLIKDIYPGGGYSIEPDSIPNHDMAEVNGLLLFSANDGIKGQELWKTDGTEAGTALVKDIWHGAWGSWPHSFTAVGNQTYFLASKNFRINQLWKTDGTSANTVLIRNLKTPYYRNSEMVELNGAVVFTTDDEGEGIWRSDGTKKGTYLLRKMEFGAKELTNVNGTIFFPGNENNLTGSELWKTDGTIAGTVLVRDINPGIYENSNPANLTNGNGTLYFVACDLEHGCELWRSGGTSSSTSLVKDIYPGPEGSWPSDLKYVNGLIVFSASDGLHGVELWKSDGTEAGTTIATDIDPGSSSSAAQFITADVNGKAVFAAADDSVDLEPWITDGFSTALLGDVNPGYAASNSAQFFRSGNLLYFEGNDGAHGPELWADSLPPSPDFKVVCTPALVRGSRSSDCKITSLNDFSNDVTLSCMNLPAGISCNFDSTTVTPPPNGSVNVTLTIDIDPSVIYDSYLFKVIAQSNGVLRSSDIWIVVMPAGALFFDDFEDGDVSDWNETSDEWSITDGNLTGTTQKKSQIFAPFSGCSNCEIEFDAKFNSAGKFSLLGWWQNKSNVVDLSFHSEQNRIALIQRSKATVVATKSISFPIQLGQTYRINIKFVNKGFTVLIDGNEVIKLQSNIEPFGTVGFQLKSINGSDISASFKQILIR